MPYNDEDSYYDYDEYLDDDYSDGYKISGYTGDCKFWSNSHELSSVNDILFARLVPSSGEADTKHGELLRAINRLTYDIFNNGLCNDKRDEIRHLQYNTSLFQPYLVDSNSLQLLKDLEETYKYGSTVTMDQKNCTALDDIIQAVVTYVQKVEEEREKVDGN